MPDLFEQRRDEHLKKSQAFLQEANNLFRDDLLYRSALADAVSAIKHSLQAYLWMRVAAVAAGDQRQRWQEVALDGSMPQLLRAAGEAGLQLSDSDRAVRELNDLRNQRAHDSPRSPITPEQAARAVLTARTIRDRVVVGLPGQVATVATRVGARLPADPVRVASADRQPAGATAPMPTLAARAQDAPPVASSKSGSSAPSPLSGEPQEEGEEEGDGAATTGELPAFSRRRGRTRTWWLLTTAAALVVGVAAGAAVTYPVAAGHPPTWLPFAAAFAPAVPTAAPHPTATGAPTGPYFAGALAVSPSGCGVLPATVTLRNTGESAVGWAAGSPDAPGATLALPSGGAAHPTLAGRLAPGASVTLTVAGLPAGGAHVVVIADGGTAQVPVGAC